MTIFAIGTFWFWTLLVVGFIVVTFFVERKDGNGWGALLSVIGLGLVLYFLGSRETFQHALRYAGHHPLTIVILAFLYFVTGTAWSIVKWYFFLKKKQRNKDWPTDWVKRDKDATGAWGPTEKISVAPKAKDHRSDILLWMSWWPFSALWTLINDPVRKAFEWIFDQMEKTFDGISDRIFRSSQNQ